MAAPDLARRLAVVFALLAAVAALSGCGRRGAPEPPGTPQEEGFAPDDIFGPTEEPDAPPPVDRPFILDPLV